MWSSDRLLRVINMAPPAMTRIRSSACISDACTRFKAAAAGKYWPIHASHYAPEKAWHMFGWPPALPKYP